MYNNLEYKLRLKHCSAHKVVDFLKKNPFYKTALVVPAVVKDMSDPEMGPMTKPMMESMEEYDPPFAMSTDDEDLEGDKIYQAGIDTEFLEKYGSVLWGHCTDHPDYVLGRVSHLRREEHKTIVHVQYADADDNPLAQKVRRMVRKGIVSGMSMGFLIREFDIAENREGMMPLDIWKSQAIETSITPIPCNPQAIVQRGLSEEDQKDLIEIMERTVEETPAGLDPVMKSTVRDVEQALNGNRIWSIGDLSVTDLQQVLVEILN